MAAREVFVKEGFALVPLTRLVETILSRVRRALPLVSSRLTCAQYRTNLSRALAEATNKFGSVAEDERIGPLLKNMNKQGGAQDFAQLDSAEKLSADRVQAAAEQNMPLCMKVPHFASVRFTSPHARCSFCTVI